MKRFGLFASILAAAMLIPVGTASADHRRHNKHRHHQHHHRRDRWDGYYYGGYRPYNHRYYYGPSYSRYYYSPGYSYYPYYGGYYYSYGGPYIGFSIRL